MYALDISAASASAPPRAVWTVALNSSSFSSPALGRKGLYVGTSDGLVAFANQGGHGMP
jgi:hypothetical protein